MAKYKFRTDEIGIDNYTRGIIKTEDVPATIKETVFTLEEKEAQLANAQKTLEDARQRVNELTKEINDCKAALNF